MYYKVEFDLILVNLLNKKTECTIKELLCLKSLIEEKIPDAFLDITKHSIFSTLEFYPKMFYWTGNTIKRTENSDRYFNDNYIEVNFNYKLPDKLKSRILDMINTNAKK
jgi:hypothetical protein